jgi:hypothetical protein
LTRALRLASPPDVHNLRARTGERALRSWIACSFLALAACGSDASDASGGADATCSAGQRSGCECAGGTAPSASGCALGSAGTSGGGAGARGAAGAAPAAISGDAGRAPAVMMGGAGKTGSAGASGAAGRAGAAGSLPPMAAGGSGGMMAMSAGSGAAPVADGGASMDECAGGMVGKASNAAGTGRGAGNVQLQFAAGNQIVRLKTTLEVPVKPSGNSTLFLWPGLEPLQGEGLNPIGTGVLQPVLTWGGSCAPGSPQSGKNWWISAQYVNTLGNDPDYKGCYGGDVMNVEIGDQLLLDMSLKGTVWTQTVTDLETMKSVDFDEDLMNQPQRWALFEIEAPTSNKPTSDVVFTNTVITLEKPEPKSCQPTARGANDYYSAPVSSPDGLKCCIARLVLRAQGVAATTMDPPAP